MLVNVLAPAVAFVLAAAEAKDQAAKDLEALQGTWTLVTAKQDGKSPAEETVKKTRIVFKGDTFRFPDAAGTATSPAGTIKVDPSKKPRAMDAVSTDGKTSPGIYEISGDDYVVCFAPPGKERPTGFSSEPGSGRILQVWKRAK